MYSAKNQIGGKYWSFSCGHKGILPSRRKKSNEYALWSIKQKGGCWVCRLCNTKQAKIWKQTIKKQIFSWYGSKCRCCQESVLDFLTLDHIHDDAIAQGRKWKLSSSGKLNFSDTGHHLYQKIRKMGFGGRPKDLQILCFNCQWGKRLNDGFCTHHPETNLKISTLEKSA